MIAAILLAGGKSSRMNLSIPKPFLSLKNRPVFSYSLDVILQQKKISTVVVVAPLQYHSLIKKDYPSVLFSEPGDERLDSIIQGFDTIKHLPFSHLLIHDAARPFVDQNDIKQLIEKGLNLDGIALAEKITATIKQIDHHKIVKTLNRDHHCLMQTPQMLKKSLFIESLQTIKNQKISITDDMQLVEVLGKSGEILLGSRYNFKLTYPEDLAYAEFLLEKNYL